MGDMQELIRRLQERSSPQTVEEYWAKQLESWKADVCELISSLKAWLAPGEEAAVFSLKDLEVTLSEDDFGQYVLAGLCITVLSGPPREVHVLPRGLRIVGVVGAGVVGGGRIVGARGRVDLVSGPSRALLLRFVDEGVTTWKIVTHTGTPTLLDADTFAAVLSELVA